MLIKGGTWMGVGRLFFASVASYITSLETLDDFFASQTNRHSPLAMSKDAATASDVISIITD